MSKILFFDIDGTLRGFDVGIMDSTKEALRRTREKGNLCIVCSGRCPAQIDKEILDLGFDGLICNNGAYVSFKDEVVFDGSFNATQIRDLTGILNDNKVPYLVQGIHQTFIEKHNKKKIYKRLKGGPSDASKVRFSLKNLIRGMQVVRIFLSNGQTIENMDAAADDFKDFQKVCYFGSPIPNDDLLKLLENYEVSGLSYGQKMDASGEITLKGINKGFGMEKLFEFLKVDRKDSICFGDGPNDFEMVEAAGYSVVMGNGIDELKAKADMVADPVQEDGLYNAMEKLQLI